MPIIDQQQYVNNKRGGGLPHTMSLFVGAPRGIKANGQPAAKPNTPGESLGYFRFAASRSFEDNEAVVKRAAELSALKLTDIPILAAGHSAATTFPYWLLERSKHGVIGRCDGATQYMWFNRETKEVERGERVCQRKSDGTGCNCEQEGNLMFVFLPTRIDGLLGYTRFTTKGKAAIGGLAYAMEHSLQTIASGRPDGFWCLPMTLRIRPKAGSKSKFIVTVEPRFEDLQRSSADLLTGGELVGTETSPKSQEGLLIESDAHWSENEERRSRFSQWVYTTFNFTLGQLHEALDGYAGMLNRPRNNIKALLLLMDETDAVSWMLMWYVYHMPEIELLRIDTTILDLDLPGITLAQKERAVELLHMYDQIV